MIEIRDYRPEDFMTIKRRTFDAITFENFANPEAVSKNLLRGKAYTLTNGSPIACAGILPLWKGVGEGWVVTSDLVEKYPVSFAKTVWRGMVHTIKTLKLERVQTIVDVEHTVSQEWVEWMGFEQEGIMRKYLGGRDFFRYALVRKI